MTSTFEQTDITATLEPIPDPHGDYCMRCERELPCVCGRLPYVTLFVRDDPLDMFVWCCNVCGLDLRDGVCELHTPKEIPGLELIPCDATPRHQRMWIVESDTFIPDYYPCPDCMWTETQKALDAAVHAQHGGWRRWRLTLRLVRVLTRARVLSYSTAYGSPCTGCITVRRRRARLSAARRKAAAS